MNHDRASQGVKRSKTMAAFAMTPLVQRRCNALIALHALHFSGHAAVAITQDQLLMDLVSKEIRTACAAPQNPPGVAQPAALPPRQAGRSGSAYSQPI